jgi:GNAT superfamily N-acetyltransferase
MPPGTEVSPSFASAKLEHAWCAGIAVESIAVGAATLLLCAERPGDIGFNRAYDVDAREPGTAGAVASAMRRAGRRPLLEIAPASIGHAARSELAALGLRELWTVITLSRDLGEPPPAPPGQAITRIVTPAEAESFGALAARAYALSGEDIAPTERLWTAFARAGRARCFVAEIDGAPAAVGLTCRWGEVALVDGAATLPERRGRGCQTALLAHRLRDAQAMRAEAAISRTGEGSASQRNLERIGFQVCRRMEVWGV